MKTQTFVVTVETGNNTQREDKKMGKKAYHNRVVKIKEIENKINALQVEMDSLKDELKKDMIKTNTEEVITGDFIIRYKAVTSNKFDSKAFRVAHSKLYASFCSPSTSMRFTIN